MEERGTQPAIGTAVLEVRVVVIGAGQAGLSSAYQLIRRGLVPHRDFVVLDANPAPGGAWLHRWPALTFDAAHALHPLPGLPLGTPDPEEPASAVVNRYYGAFEEMFRLPVIRPVRVLRVEPATPGDMQEPSGSIRTDGPLTVTTTAGTWRADVVISATGTWDRPYWPSYPGRGLFAGRQLHTHDYRSAEEFAGRRVLVVGAGTSAVPFLLRPAAAGARTVWSTRRPPEFVRRPFDAEWGREVEAEVGARTAAGLPPESVVAATGLPLTPEYRAGIDAGVLVSRGPLAELREHTAVFTDGSEEEVDVVLWATGFRASLQHLAPLRIREPGGGIRMDGVRVVKEPRLMLVGYGASASTLGATRAGRAAARAAVARVTEGGEGGATGNLAG
ncbi:pyridine nucleotide-disulfide oxidoreductase [Arthrobacter sp. RIT-PI-e]|uniref:NAD(P)-binding domain-containing protein n=1 Tax=Arthrobacter sp. RIT-PI-e TaxID=1681197 RepID=UPI000675FC03|nr:NAD(P)-binding domain-containing protein [Arthrobacter sp. RIT-PI-e]KNC19687.1 pyridine nucleotide-disulfide oxidoreductase [Arthrobacter sp. RIT-PI-e]